MNLALCHICHSIASLKCSCGEPACDQVCREACQKDEKYKKNPRVISRRGMFRRAA